MSNFSQRGPIRPPAAGQRGPARLASKHSSADESPGLLLWQVTNRWQAAQRAALKPFDLTHVQFVLLATLTWLGDGLITQKQLAQHSATDPMMTSQVLRTLEERGLICRGRHPTDARARTLSVTSSGAALANRAIVAVEGCDADFFKPLGHSSTQFTTQLRALRQHARRDERLPRHAAAAARSTAEGCDP
ncbi:MAG: winged helix-turn-helix transcriptional regulator [Nocardioidaceae bacterium]|nr:winged helix-turn-helix transcriptional regulator [Nocardioidaceae bacterium]